MIDPPLYFSEHFQLYFVCISLGLAFVATAIGIIPILHHSRFGYQHRREDILEYFDDRSIGHYFEKYRPNLGKECTSNLNGFATFYDQRFGRSAYWLPALVYVPALLVSIATVLGTALAIHYKIDIEPGIQLVASALAGAYMWVLADLLARYVRRDVVPSAIYGYAVRFTIVIPVSVALWLVIPERFGPTFAIVLGAFPTQTLFTFLRRLATKIGLGKEAYSSKPESELEDLQGVTTAIAERFADIGITTLLELAYEDPIELTMRMHLRFRDIVDLMSQALLMLYVAEIGILRRYAIRSSMDAASLFEELTESADTDLQQRARAVVNALAVDLKMDQLALERILSEISDDPANIFLTELPF